MADDGAIPLHPVSSTSRESRVSFIEVARPTTGEIPTIAPTQLEEVTETVSGVDAPPAIFGSKGREFLIIGICTWAPASQASSIGAVLVGLDIIATDLGMTQGEISWIPGALSLTSGSFLLLGGRLADLYGRKKMLSLSMLGFTIWTLIASFSTEKYMPGWELSNGRYLFFVSRGMQGVFASGGTPAALGILGAAYPPGKRKNRVFATFSAGNPTGWVVGLLIGGFLTSYASWCWGFRVITIITAVITGLSFIYVPPDAPRDPLRRKEKVDWLGAILIICGITGICYALSDAGNTPNGWRTWYIIFSLLLGCVFVGLFLWWESRVQYPLMPLSIWKVPQFLRLMVVIALGFSCFTGFLGFTWSLWFQQIDQASPITTTLYFLPQFFSGVGANVVAAMIMHRVNGTILLVGSMLCYSISGLMGALQPPGTIYWAMSFPAMRILHFRIALSLVIGVIGADMSNVVANMFATSNVSKEFQSIAVAIVVTMLGVSQTVGQSITSALITDLGGNGLSGDVPIDQLAKGFHAAFWFGFAVSIIAAVIAMTLRIGTRGHKGERDLREISMTANDSEAISTSTARDNTEIVHRNQPKQ